MGSSFIRYLLLSLVVLHTLARAEDLDSGINKLSADLSVGIAKSGSKKISVIDFSDLQGRDSDFGRFIAEQLSVSLVNSAKDYAVLDRANMKSILDEHKLTASGLVNPDNARKLGQFAGVDAIVLGSISTFGQSVYVTAKAISTETTQVLAAARLTISRSKDIDVMLVSKQSATTPDAVADGVNQPPPQPVRPQWDFTAPNNVESFGDISIEVLSFKSVQSGVIALFRITNLGRRNPIKVGINGHNDGQHGTYLLDEYGTMYTIAQESGISSTQDTGAAGNGPFTTFVSLRNLASETDIYSQRRLFQDLDQMSDVPVGTSIDFTIGFASQGRGTGTNYRFNAELIVVQMISDQRVRISMHNVVIPDIRPRN
ncbi:MAG TPA: FlgO family outer membrane protein [Fimbriimonas sp.]|nr:FlgO family outer membrane protein [Fimbriimonas sp.]